MRTVFVRPERCIGCKQCEFACAVEHSQSRDPVLALFEQPVPVPRIQVFAGPQGSAFPNRCRHCDPAPCERACPAGAIGRDVEHDVVLVSAGRCIACAMCAMVCPFDAINFHALLDGARSRIVATKCDGCVERVASGREPACVEACKVGALVYGEINEIVEEDRARGAWQALESLKVAEEVSRA